MTRVKKLQGWFILFLCNLIWAFQFTSIKLTQEQVGPYFTVWGPMLLSVLLLAPLAYRDYRKNPKSKADILVFLQLGLLGAFPSQVLMTYGTQYSLASNAAIIVLALPVLTAVFAFFMLREKMNAVRWCSFVVAIAGVLLCSTGDLKRMDLGSRYALGNLLIFLAVAGNAYYNVGCKKIAEKYTEVEMVFYTYVVLVIILTPFVLYYEPGIFQTIPGFTITTWLGLGALTLFHNFLSMLLFFSVLKYLDAIQVGLSNYLITLIGLPIASVLLSERISASALFGGALVLLSTLSLTIIESRETAKAPAKNKLTDV